ncbi:MOSC N-terminal beta barrel domain-containing protein [Streptomyces capparidis]
MITVVALHCYPVKGCAGIPLERAELTPAGIAHDRAFMVTDDAGTFRSQRRDPRLALVRPDITAEGDVLVLRADGFGEVRVEVDTTGPRRDVELFGKPFLGIDQGGAAADWLSEVLGARSRLVRVPPEHDRVTDGLVPGTCGWADSGAVHLVSAESFALLNDRIAAQGGQPLPMDRFRPNIVARGWAEPHQEDGVRRARVGEAELAYTKPAIRCAVTVVDQERGVRSGPEPLRALAGYRRSALGGVTFGVKFAVPGPGRLAVGDEVAVTAWGEPEV